MQQLQQQQLPRSQPPDQRYSEAAELDDLMANLTPSAGIPRSTTSKTSNNPGQRGSFMPRVSAAPSNSDLEDMLNSLSGGTPNYNADPRASLHGGVALDTRSSIYGGAPVDTRGNNFGGVSVDPRATVGGPGRNTNQQQARPPVRGGPSTRDLNDIMEGLNDTVPKKPIGQPAVTPARKPEQKLPRGMCAGCRKTIGGTQKVQAMGKEYHPEHFQCSTCAKVIGNANFYEKEGQPQCNSCFQSVFCQKCAQCQRPIATQALTALGQSWHPDCFVCTTCNNPFNNASFFERNNKPYCSVCIHDTFSQKCRSCNQPIRGNSITALGHSWHPDHFNCQACHRAFANNAFYEVNGLPYCDAHYNQISTSS